MLRIRTLTACSLTLVPIERNDARGGGGGDGDGRRYQQRLVYATATDHMLNGLHRLGGTDGNTIDGELEPGLQRVRGERVVEAVDTVEIVVGLLDIFAVETGLG